MSPRDEARTPRDFFDRLDRRFCFALDAACNAENVLLGDMFRREGKGLIWPETDALRVSWEEHSQGCAVWLNPPYSNLEPWLHKARKEGERVTVVALLPADPSTAWWQEYVRRHAAEILFVVGRLRFLNAQGLPFAAKGGGGGFRGPSAVVIWRAGHNSGNDYAWHGYISARVATENGLKRRRGTHRLVTLGQETRTLNDWATRLGIPRTTIAGRLDSGWPAERALSITEGASHG